VALRTVTQKNSLQQISVRAMDPGDGGGADRRKYGIRLARNSVGRLLAQLGITPQKPLCPGDGA
jgi:hypothetical protein